MQCTIIFLIQQTAQFLYLTALVLVAAKSLEVHVKTQKYRKQNYTDISEKECQIQLRKPTIFVDKP